MRTLTRTHTHTVYVCVVSVPQRHKAHLRKTNVCFPFILAVFWMWRPRWMCAMCNKHTLVALRIIEAVCSLTVYGVLIIFMPWKELSHSIRFILFHSVCGCFFLFTHLNFFSFHVLLNVEKIHSHSLEIQVKFMRIFRVLIRWWNRVFGVLWTSCIEKLVHTLSLYLSRILSHPYLMSIWYGVLLVNLFCKYGTYCILHIVCTVHTPFYCCLVFASASMLDIIALFSQWICCFILCAELLCRMMNRSTKSKTLWFDGFIVEP